MSFVRFACLASAFVIAGTAPAQAQAPVPAASPLPAAVAAPKPATEIVHRADLAAEYFAADPAKASPGSVIVLGGSEGGFGWSRGLARRLAAEGFAALAVSYFGEPGQSSRLNEVPIEPVDAAIAWLASRPEIRGPVAVVGVSKGAELALLTASRNPAIKAVVAGVPSSVVWAGIDREGGPVGSSWSAAGQPLTYAPYDMTNGFTSVFNLYADSLAKAPAGAEIPVETIAGPILMISGEADGLWPSSLMAARIERRLEAHGFTHPVVNLAYPEAGHAAFGPPVRPDAPGLAGALSLGGTMEGLIAARADGWPRVLTFLRDALSK